MYANGISVADITKTLHENGSDIRYQSVYAYTAGKEKTEARRVKYRILNMGKSKKKSVGEIAERAGVSTSKVTSILKAAKIATVTKEQLTKNKKEKKNPSEATAKKSTKKAAKKTSSEMLCVEPGEKSAE